MKMELRLFMGMALCCPRLTMSLAPPLSLLSVPGLVTDGSAPSSVLTLRIRGPSSTDAEPVEVQSVCDHILLRLEQDDVHLGCEQAAQDHKATEADGDAHGGRLHLQERVVSLNVWLQIQSCGLLKRTLRKDQTKQGNKNKQTKKQIIPSSVVSITKPI